MRNLSTDLIINVGKNRFTRRPNLGIVQCTLHFGKTFTEDIEIQFLHFQFGSCYFFFVLILLLELFVFQLCYVIAQFCLTHFICCSRSQTVQIVFVPKFHFHAAQFHGRDLNLHRHIGKFRLIIDAKLIQLIAAHLFFVKQFFIFRFRALKVEFQNRSTDFHTIPSFSVYLNDTTVNGRIDDFFKCRDYLTGGADTNFNHSLINCRKYQILLFHSCPHDRYKYADNNYTGHSYR